MTKSEAQINQFERVIKNLKDVLVKIKTETENYDVFRDSAIQRFEIAFDVCWKTLKEKLRSDFGIDETSPEKVFQEAFKQNLIENDIVWLEMTDIRNETTHAYGESYAENVLKKLPDIQKVLEELLWKLKK